MSDDGIAEIMREMERNALRLQNGIKLALGMEFARVGPTPKRTVWSSGKVELWHYDTEPGAVRYGPPILLVPSVVSRSYVFDLHRGNSFVEHLLEAGFSVYLVDWGVAGPEESANTFETYVDELMPQLVAAACEDAGTDEVTMLGYCFSGLLTMLYLAGHPDAPIRSLISLAPPIDYSASSGITKVFAEGRLEPDDILDEDGNVPGDVVREAFAMRKPTSEMVTNAALWDNLWKDDYVEGHQAMAQFIREQVPLPGALLRQIVTKLIRGNELATGVTELGGRPVDLRDIKLPLLVVMAERDELVPVESTLILREFMGPNMEELSLPAGHVGLITGRKAATVTIPHILGWIAEHSQPLKESEVRP
ncbi:MAG: poly[(R)-3-hydroxyalkanoate] polymerase subunit PhaC [Solirubrobacteraceae bacterium]|jgi:polyhydroxyalkanoate synthase|nr:poly[(R)-3-hydroxyalkanoate] polymerase subunit PhaC [Solirubrobacteraceae bacterium]